MNYKIKTQDGILIVGSAKNKQEMRKRVLECVELQKIVSVQYGTKTYTMSDVYAGR